MKAVFKNSILACVFLFLQCDNKEVFIEKIKEMDLEMQQLLVPYIQEVRFLGCKFLLHLFDVVFGISSSIICHFNQFSKNCEMWKKFLVFVLFLFVSNFVLFLRVPHDIFE